MSDDTYTTYKTLAARIEELRKQIDDLIDRKQGLNDCEILAASRKLDTLINEYNQVIDMKKHSLIPGSRKAVF